jgi:hypothetical protein
LFTIGWLAVARLQRVALKGNGLVGGRGFAKSITGLKVVNLQRDGGHMG